MQWAADIETGKSSHKFVLVMLANTHHDKNNTCYASLANIVAFTELNWKTVNAAIDWLEKAGFIRAERRQGKATKFTLNFDVTTSKTGVGKKQVNSDNLVPHTPSKTGAGAQIVTPSKNGDDPLQKRSEPPPELEHKRDNGNNGKKVNLLVEDSESHDELITPPNPKNANYLQAAHAMWDRIQPITQREQPPNFENWARDIRLLVENDKKPPELVWRIFLWANADDFWRVNILSPAKLRKQFDQLYAKSNMQATTKFDRNVQVGKAWLENRNGR